MTLLCLSLLVLLLLPLSLSCNSSKIPTEVLSPFVQELLRNTRERVTTLLQNSSCLERRHKHLSCIADKANILKILLRQACKMQSLELSDIERLASNVQTSIDCPCPEKDLRQNRHNKSKSETKKLCIAKAFLSSMTVCYEMLNTLVMDT
uniref:Interleukin-7 n=1 Tax=Nothobranchius furzeri TaxID=105023 RepID=A0A8C6P652_NOTFU